MGTFPSFMKQAANRVDRSSQHTGDVEGYWYEAADGSQMAFWTAKTDRESAVHSHPFDEYVVCVEGQYTVTMNGHSFLLFPGDECHIPTGTKHGGNVKAGTRTIHAFGGKRIQ